MRAGRLVVIAALAGLAYWLWQRRQGYPESVSLSPGSTSSVNDTVRPIAPNLHREAPTAPNDEGKRTINRSPSVAPSAPASASNSGARLIPTRVHRGAPPTTTQSPEALVSSESDGVPEAAQPTDEPTPEVATPPVEPAAQALTTLGDSDGIPEDSYIQPEVIAVVGSDSVPEVSSSSDQPQLAIPAPDSPESTPELLASSEDDSVPESATTAPSDALLNVNSADLDALIALPGIGPVIARRILDYRAANGPFTTIEQLIDIQGIGPNNIDQFRHLITL